MSVLSRSACASLAVLAGLFASNTSWAVTICFDPGHGGVYGRDPAPPDYQWGAQGANCYEKDMNLNVGLAAWWVGNGWNNYRTVLTRTADEVVTYAERVAVADGNSATVFLSAHHDGGNPPDNPRYYTTVGLYCDQGPLGSYWAMYSATLGMDVAREITSSWGQERGILDGGSAEDDVYAGRGHFYVIRNNNRPSTLVEACDAMHLAANQLCDPIQYNTAAYDQAAGYFWGVVQFTGIVGVGVSFAAEPYDIGAVRLTWEEDDPSRVVTYAIYRSDKCWGPWEYVASVQSQDPQYTPDNRHYTYTAGAPYNRVYWFKLVVMGEAPRASVTPDGFQPSPVGIPSGLSGSGVDNGGGTGTVTLTWNPATGVVDGYHVYRSRYVGMSNCDALFEYLGVATGPTFVDSSAPTGMLLFYRVRAFNATDGSEMSNEIQVGIQQTVGVERNAAGGSADLHGIWPNPTRDQVTLAYAIGTRGTVRLAVYDIAGRVVAESLRREVEAGEHQAMWDGRTPNGMRLPSGVYFLVLSVDGKSLGRRRLAVVR